jgi:glycosyltransferase involved in cell wall biosynthesis
MVVNRDAFFLSHRLPLARGARDAGMEVIVVAGNSGSGPAIEREGLAFIPLPISRSGVNPVTDAATLAFLMRLYRRLRPDLIHHSTIKPVVYGSLVARVAGDAGVVNTISGLGYALTSEDRLAQAVRPLLRRLLRSALRHPRSRTIFQNAEDLTDFVGQGLIREKDAVLIRGSGVHCSVFRVTPEPSEEPIVMLAARMLWDKGVREFVEAARLSRRTGQRARFVLVGAPDEGNRASLPVAQLENWARDGVVEWWGYQSNMAEVWSRASVAVLPTLYGEGVPKALLEAAASGRPIVATDVRGCREIVRPGVNGLLVPAGNSAMLAQAIGRLLESPQLRRNFGEAGRRIAELEFAEPYVIDQTLAVYRHLLDQGDPGERASP